MYIQLTVSTETCTTEGENTTTTNKIQLLLLQWCRKTMGDKKKKIENTQVCVTKTTSNLHMESKCY